VVSDLAIAKLGFAESRNAADALLTVAKLRLEVEAVRTEATQHAEATGITDPAVSIEIDPVAAGEVKSAGSRDRLDRTV
jgi:hypothetical protein